MRSPERLRSLIRDIYSAAADELRWPATLERLADEFRGGVAGFQYRAGLEGRIRSSRFVRLDPALADTYRTYFATRNPWTRLSQPLCYSGFVYASDRYLTLAELRRTEFYDQICRPMGLVHCFGACVFKRGDDVLSFTVLRSPMGGAYEADELKHVPALLPHLRRAVEVNERLSQLRRSHRTLANGLEHLQHGVVLVDRNGRVVFANRAARAIVAQQDGLSITTEGLVVSAFAERLRLRALLDDAVRTTAGEGFGWGGALTVPRRSMKRAFLVLVAPLPLPLEGERRSGMATVFISDPEAHTETLEALARRLYGLTATEARVAGAFAATGSLEHVGDQLGISRETVRWHFRHLYRKTGTHRQAALLRRLNEASSRLVLQAADSAGVLSGRD